jgi:quinol monooxygenase YgiN
MPLPVLIGFAGVLVAAVATGVLAGRCVRQPRIDFIVWTAATLALTIALAAQSMGFQSGFGPVTFRAVQLFALLLAPLWLAWGLVELTAASETVRFGMRLVAGALTVVGSVILSTDPLTAQPFGQAWPLTAPHFQPISQYALDVVQAVAVLAVAAGAALAAARARNDSPWRPAMAAVIPVGLAVLLTIALRFPLPARAAYPLLTMLAAALVWFGVSRVPQQPQRAARRAGLREGRRDGMPDGSARRGPGDRPDGDYWPDDRYGPVDEYVPEGQYAIYGQRTGGPGRPRKAGDLPGTGPAARPGSGGVPGRRVASGPQPQPQPQAPERQDWYRGPGPGGPGADDGLSGTRADRPPGTEAAALAGSGAAPGSQAGPAGSPAAAPARPYGRLQIFTLLDDRTADFDRLAEQTAEEVRTGEPDTLVYVIHLVPNAPLQRIFYEVYRDRAAFDSHESQPYVQRFAAERRACVLATNVIELRLKYAKVAPLPNPQVPAPAPAAPALAAPSPGSRPQLPAGPPPRPQSAGARGPQRGSGPYGVPGPQGPQRLQPLPPARSQRPGQPRPDQQRPDQQRPDQRYPDQQRPDQRWPDQRQVPSAGRRY